MLFCVRSSNSAAAVRHSPLHISFVSYTSVSNASDTASSMSLASVLLKAVSSNGTDESYSSLISAAGGYGLESESAERRAESTGTVGRSPVRRGVQEQ